MKKHHVRRFSMIVIICLAVSFANNGLAAAEPVKTYASNDFTYTLVDGLACNIRYQGLSGNVVIPDKFDGKRAATIGDGAFMNYPFIEKVTIHSNLKSIGSYTFYGCSELTSVSIPKSVRFIGERAFAGCNHLTLTVVEDSYAVWYAEENGIPYILAE